jgi:hypothetical protein
MHSSFIIKEPLFLRPKNSRTKRTKSFTPVDTKEEQLVALVIDRTINHAGGATTSSPTGQRTERYETGNNRNIYTPFVRLAWKTAIETDRNITAAFDEGESWDAGHQNMMSTQTSSSRQSPQPNSSDKDSNEHTTLASPSTGDKEGGGPYRTSGAEGAGEPPGPDQQPHRHLRRQTGRCQDCRREFTFLVADGVRQSELRLDVRYKVLSVPSGLRTKVQQPCRGLSSRPV